MAHEKQQAVHMRALARARASAAAAAAKTSNHSQNRTGAFF